MTREHKLSLIIGFTVVLLVFVLLTDHLSRERTTPLAGVGEQDQFVVDALPPDGPIAMPSARNNAGGAALASFDPAQSPGQPLSMPHAPLQPEPSPQQPSMLASAASVASEWGSAVVESVGQTLASATPASQTQPSRLDDITAPSTGGEFAPMTPGPVVIDMPSSRSAVVRRQAGGAAEQPASSPAGAVAWHTVKKNESLYAIARDRLGDGNRWRELAKANPALVGADGSVREGVRLRLPTPALASNAAPMSTQPTAGNAPTSDQPRAAGTTSAPATKPAPASPPGKPKQQSTPRPGSTRVYVVRSGDTLGEIASRELGSVKRVRDILSMNKSTLRDPDAIVANMELRLPTD